MNKTIRSIVCDNCETELIVDSSYPSHYVIQVESKDLGINTTGMTYGIHMTPPIPESMHFCNKACLKKWFGEDV